MKKSIFLLFVSIAFFACSNDDNVSGNGENPNGLVFEISAKTQLNETKAAGAPVYSQDAAQSVTSVSIHAFKGNGTDYLYTKTYEVSGWTAGSTFKRFAVPEADKLTVGDYKFLVIGRDATDLYQLTAFTTSTKIEDVLATITNSGDEYEIFAGTAQAQVLEEGGTRVSLTMTRKVAGVLGYFQNVPQLLNGSTVRYLRLIASAGNTQVNLLSGAGITPAASYDIINIDLSGQAVANEIYTGNDLSAAQIVKLPNSQLGGAYMIPVSDVTLTLGLYDASNNPLKVWTVYNGTASTFNILANHFYSLGVKHKPDTTTGTDPANPGDDDDAIDLLQDQTITITIDPAWNTIHPLTIQ
ncbi:FimB/Mfa2 family fimbrial subunit [Dysgonomonas sp. Marseille-P4677]|uniref:FimB/Mfa2 family fimbrial subunit n=1 Tax=Dysgonomonas sp. Marseille-P4677 TaxID=2364790 RepID=UPI0019124E6B|nr:FimB/Mfa2 family fimbrial subunit [Dysgonomonas sp. Marseille-P4677]MBK5722989.1 FimB/Mfa2 family fimbrial subunit [Dysgonomonas sp. Marseille-P4677]